MTGPGPGKISLKNTRVIIDEMGHQRELENAVVYIHLKGYSRARVTHIDIEHDELNKIIPARSGGFYKIRREDGNLVLDLSRLIRGLRIIIDNNMLASILKPYESSWCYVGGKPGGIYIGLKKYLIERLEKLAEKFQEKDKW